MNLKDIKPAAGSTHRKKRIGRGIGSGHGKTAGRGHKGRGSRSGGNTPARYEGGQMPLRAGSRSAAFAGCRKTSRRANALPRSIWASWSVSPRARLIDPAVLVDRGLVRAGRKIKVLGGGDLKIKLSIRAHAFSGNAREKIAAAAAAPI